jgi:DNA polymerase-3 subunit beta
MQITINQADLNNAIDLVSRAVPSRAPLPILANILLAADEGKQAVTLTAYDMSIGITATVSATVTTGGSICLPAKLFADIVAKLSAATVEISAADLALTLSAGGGSYNLSCLAPDDFPALPSPDSEPLEIPTDSLLVGLRSTIASASSDEAKQTLTGIKFKSTPDGTEFAATNGHHLAVSCQSGIDVPIDIVLPGKAAQALIKLLSGKECLDSVTTVLEGQQMMFSCGSQSIVTRLLDGQYPNYNQLIPKQFQRSITVDRKSLIASLERIAVMADQKNNVVKLSIGPEAIIASAEAADVGSASEAIAADVSGDPLDIAFNVIYLLNGLKVMSSPEVLIEVNSATSPVAVSPLGGSKMIYLLMPVQIRS